jgi:hypothetical protein
MPAAPLLTSTILASTPAISMVKFLDIFATLKVKICPGVTTKLFGTSRNNDLKRAILQISRTFNLKNIK